MTRIGFMSDLHLDSNQFGEAERMQLLQVLQEEQIDHLHLAGDISNDFKQISLPFIQDLQRQLPVSFNLGNHDMLSLSEEEIKQYDFQVQTFGDSHLVSLADGTIIALFLKRARKPTCVPRILSGLIEDWNVL